MLQNLHEYRGITLVTQTAISGVQVRCGRAPIDAFQQHRKLRTRQTNGAFRGLRPDLNLSSL